MSNTQPLLSPALFAEQTIIKKILQGTYPPGGTLPNERTLAKELGITRPTLRETLKRMERDGWISINHGKSTMVNNYLEQGGLNVLSGICSVQKNLPSEMVIHLLVIREEIAPCYISKAIRYHPNKVAQFLLQGQQLKEDAETYCQFDWTLHHTMTLLSQNPIYTLILNGFKDNYAFLGKKYFALPEARSTSQQYYHELALRAKANDPSGAFELSRKIFHASINLWKSLDMT